MSVRCFPAGRMIPGSVFALGLFLVLLGGCGDGDLAEHLERGRSMLSNEQYEDAQLEGLYVLLREPENEEALHLVALSLLSQNRDGEAEGYFHNLAQISQDYAREAAMLYDGKAREDFESGETNRAARRWGMALSFDPGLDLGPHAFFMADRAFDARRWQRAASLYSQALAAYPDSSAVGRSLYPYGVCLHRLERYDEALNVLEPFLQRYPRHARHHEGVWLYQELLIHEARGAHARMDYERAVALLRKALRYDDNPPKTAEALLELGLNYEQLQEYGKAASCYQRIVEANTAGSGRVYDNAMARLEKLEKARLR